MKDHINPFPIDWPKVLAVAASRQPGIEASINEIIDHFSADNGDPARHALRSIISRHCISRGAVDPVWTGDDLIEINNQALEERDAAVRRVNELESQLNAFSRAVDPILACRNHGITKGYDSTAIAVYLTPSDLDSIQAAFDGRTISEH